MAKLYWTKDIKDIFEKKIEEAGACLINDRSISEESLLRHIREIRIFQKYASEIIEDMEEADRLEEEERERYKAARLAAEQAREEEAKAGDE